MRVIVLAAGQGFDLDGMNKILIRDPRDGKTIFEKYREIFNGLPMTVVVGYRAVNIMNQYPDADYVYNRDWKVTSNSHSLALTLTEEPCYVLSSDLIFEKDCIERLREGPADCVLTDNRASRGLSALNCSLESDRLDEVYSGPVRSPQDPEAIGVFKITTPAILRQWKKNCLQYGNLFVAQNLPARAESPIYSVSKGPSRFFEVNTPLDYIRLLQDAKTKEK
jgi:choline kinase